MTELQNAYISLMTNRPAPFVPRNNPVVPSIAGLQGDPSSAIKANPAPTPPPSRLSQGPNFTPAIRSPLATSQPISFHPPESPMVFLVQEVPADGNSRSVESNPDDPPPLELISDESSDDSRGSVLGNAGASSRGTSPVERVTIPPPAEFAMVQDEPSAPATATVPPGEPTDTAPSSPTIAEGEKRVNRFERSRMVGKEELLASLRMEAEYLQEDLAAAEACNSNEVYNYAQRLEETISRIKQMEVEQVGEINIYKMFLAGLRHIIYVTDSLTTTPLPHNSPPLIPSTPIVSTEEALTRVIATGSAKGNDFEQSRAQGEPAFTLYNQPRSDIIPQCPSQPHTNVDLRSVPIANRPYFKGGANDFVRKAGGVRANLFVDIRSLTIIDNGDHVPAAFLRQFTELTGHLAPYIFPGRVAPTYDWPLDVPESSATTYQERVIELRQARREIEHIYQATIRALTKTQLAECLTPHLTLHKRISESSSQLSPIKIDRIYFWQRLHPVWNPLLKPVEAAFLRGAIYMYYGEGKTECAEELERVLRTPHFDDWEVRELVSLGALDNEFRENKALAYFKELDDEHWDFHAHEEAFHKSANEILDAMEEDMEDKQAITNVRGLVKAEQDSLPITT
jgi:hypothetical protein